MRPSFDGARDANDVAHIALGRALEIMGTRKGNVQLIRWNDGATLHIAAQEGFGHEFLTVFKEVTLEHPSVCGRALALRRTVVVPDVMTDPEFRPYRDVAVRAGFRAVQSTPLLSSGGSMVGVVSTHSEEPGRPSELQLAEIAALGRLAADAIIAIRTHGQALGPMKVPRAKEDWLSAYGMVARPLRTGS